MAHRRNDQSERCTQHCPQQSDEFVKNFMQLDGTVGRHKAHCKSEKVLGPVKLPWPCPEPLVKGIRLQNLVGRVDDEGVGEDNDNHLSKDDRLGIQLVRWQNLSDHLLLHLSKGHVAHVSEDYIRHG